MSNKKEIFQIIEDFVTEERMIEPNPYLATRVMATLAKKEVSQLSLVAPFWRVFVLGLGLFVAIFSGITVGGLYQTTNERSTILYINDGSIENLDFYNQMANE